MKMKAQGGVAGVGGASAAATAVASVSGSAEATPVPLRRDSIRHISFIAPSHVAGESLHVLHVRVHVHVRTQRCFNILCIYQATVF